MDVVEKNCEGKCRIERDLLTNLLSFVGIARGSEIGLGRKKRRRDMWVRDCDGFSAAIDEQVCVWVLACFSAFVGR